MTDANHGEHGGLVGSDTYGTTERTEFILRVSASSAASVRVRSNNVSVPSVSSVVSSVTVLCA
jgi:hypothetical protein